MTIDEHIIANDILRSIDQGLGQRPFYKDTKVVEEMQTAKGVAKYPTTVNPKDYRLSGWLRHRQQEDFDGLVYTTCAIQIAEEIEKENERLREALEVIAADTKTWTNPDETIPYVNRIAREALAE